jgi:hypothetical protein
MDRAFCALPLMLQAWTRLRLVNVGIGKGGGAYGYEKGVEFTAKHFYELDYQLGR